MDKNTGHLLLAGGAEFGGQMAEPDRQAIDLAGGPSAKISIIPTAAAPDNNHQRAGENGERWFRQLGASQVSVVSLIDRASANDPRIAEQLRTSGLIYMLGGFTHYLGQTLLDSDAWAAALEAYHAGAVIGGSSAGAMVMCDTYFDPSAGAVRPGLGLLPNACILPHHDTFGYKWAARLAALLPRALLIGIDERTGMIDDSPDGSWTVYGKGAVTLYHDGQPTVYSTGESFSVEKG